MKKLIILCLLMPLCSVMQATVSDSDSIALMRIYKEATIGEVVVKGSRPLVKVENGMLHYNLNALSEKKNVSNVFEAIASLPGIMEKDGALSLNGASSVSVILDGRPTTMTQEQLNTLLKSMSVDRVVNVEVMYSAPPRYHVRGAAINIVTKRAGVYSFQGELKAVYQNQYFSSCEGGANFRVSTPKMAFDLMYDADDVKTMQHYTMDSHHTYQNKVYDISQSAWGRYKDWNHSLRAAYEYNISDKSLFSIAYTTLLSPSDNSVNDVMGNYQTSRLDKYMRSYLHNVSVAFQLAFGLKMSANYTNYHSVNSQLLQSDVNEEDNQLQINGGQDVRKISLSADQTHSLRHDWTLDYGISYVNAYDKDNQYYTDVKGSMPTADTDTRLTEQSTDFYVSCDKTYKSGPSFSLSASGEYYTIGNYHKWAFYPQASVTYFKTPKHVFILSLSSDKTYPSYWQMQSSVTHLDGYQEIRGSSHLRPCSTYSLNATYAFNRKYTFSLFYEDAEDYFTQSMYQSSERLALIFQTRNWNYSRQYGLVINAPFSIGTWFNTQLMAMGLHQHEKCADYFDIPFDRNKWLYQLSAKNTFSVSPHFNIQLDGMYTSPLIQGTYDLTHFLDVDASVKWRFCKDKCALTVRLQDIFNSGLPKTKVNYVNQKFDMNTTYYQRSLSITFSYRFGGYKGKEHKEIDTSRFGH